MSRSPSLTRKACNVQQAVTDIKQRVAALASVLLQDERGVDRHAYNHLACLFAELGEMPSMPEVTMIGDRYFTTQEAVNA